MHFSNPCIFAYSYQILQPSSHPLIGSILDFEVYCFMVNISTMSPILVMNCRLGKCLCRGPSLGPGRLYVHMFSSRPVMYIDKILSCAWLVFLTAWKPWSAYKEKGKNFFYTWVEWGAPCGRTVVRARPNEHPSAPMIPTIASPPGNKWELAWTSPARSTVRTPYITSYPPRNQRMEIDRKTWTGFSKYPACGLRLGFIRNNFVWDRASYGLKLGFSLEYRPHLDWLMSWTSRKSAVSN